MHILYTHITRNTYNTHQKDSKETFHSNNLYYDIQDYGITINNSDYKTSLSSQIKILVRQSQTIFFERGQPFLAFRYSSSSGLMEQQVYMHWFQVSLQ